MVTIDIEADSGQGRRLVCRAFVTANTHPSRDLLRGLLVENATTRFGAFALVDSGDIVFQHSIVADHLDREEFLATVDAVALTADEFDDRIVIRFGGHTAIPLKAKGGLALQHKATPEVSALLRRLRERGVTVRDFENPVEDPWDPAAQMIGKNYDASSGLLLSIRRGLAGAGTFGVAGAGLTKDQHRRLAMRLVNVEIEMADIGMGELDAIYLLPDESFLWIEAKTGGPSGAHRYGAIGDRLGVREGRRLLVAGGSETTALRDMARLHRLRTVRVNGLAAEVDAALKR